MALALTAATGAFTGGLAAPFLPRRWYAGGVDPVVAAYVDGVLTVIVLVAWVWVMRRKGWEGALSRADEEEGR